MTAPKLRLLVTPEVEQWMKSDGIWPTRFGSDLKCNEDFWWYGGLQTHNYPDDAAAQIERALVRHLAIEAHEQDTNGPCIEYVSVNGDDWSLIVGRGRWLGASPLHCLLAAYSASKDASGGGAW